MNVNKKKQIYITTRFDFIIPHLVFISSFVHKTEHVNKPLQIYMKNYDLLTMVR